MNSLRPKYAMIKLIQAWKKNTTLFLSETIIALVFFNQIHIKVNAHKRLLSNTATK